MKSLTKIHYIQEKRPSAKKYFITIIVSVYECKILMTNLRNFSRIAKITEAK